MAEPRKEQKEQSTVEKRSATAITKKGEANDE